MENDEGRTRQASLKINRENTSETSLAPRVGRYTRDTDASLTRSQKQSGLFQSDGNYRVSSRQTAAGHSTGMHEEVLPTDVWEMLVNAERQSNGEWRITTTNRASPFYKAGAIYVDPTVRKWALQAGDGFRADTARTALSVNGGATGHSGSNLSLKGQMAAHDAVRETLITILQEKPSSEVTQRSIICAFASMASLSSAPGEQAEKMPNIASLKDQAALSDWEVRRDAGKQRVDAVYAEMTQPEQNFAYRIANEHLARIDSPNSTRTLDPERPRSPPRSLRMNGPIQGGEYVPGGLQAAGVSAPPAALEDYPMYASSGRRAPR
ncbi:hypothetical protein HLH34_18290 [Gluconacetobacter azotocaptans]|uniref:Uncharacterized protein n=1 Tax=Gluconacetobacter azotocaptans TaxID=142834 RepID=A0A7W4JVX5_9PROT|nr:hypothetical protein [Gluconacetobacter azotocaptans]MBB2191884.1 hypothetical protein [Gluconacetobacter azotocaptans]GBQ30619.1 hypothetical protein AA13594_1799 [Gluconacetobacter azotocaptans DSM 13594]